MNQLTEKVFYGEETALIIPELGALRIRVFYDFPYLYEGNLEYEKNYLKIYGESDESIVFTVFDGDKLVGATTGMPLKMEEPEIQQPFLNTPEGVDAYFYFGESILLPEYRGLGIGHRFFDVREAHARKLGYPNTIFCSVIRPENNPLKPENYHPNNAFWTKRSYERLDGVTCEMSWLDRDENAETVKSLEFWKHEWK